MSVVIVAPGQGSQAPGFLTPWLTEPVFSEHIDRLAEAAGTNLRGHGTVSDAETIRDTAIAQPLIVAAALVSLGGVFTGHRREKIFGVAGHSVGEFTAASAAGILTEEQAMRLVSVRAQAMALAAGKAQTGMSAVIGGDENELLGRLESLGLEPANFNGGGQIVVAGALPALEKLRENPPPGARVISLQVAGAFHTRYMDSAVAALRKVTSEFTPGDPSLRIWTNCDGTEITEGKRFLELMVNQVASPVRWDRVMESFSRAGVTGLIELAPAGALTGLAKRGLKGIPVVAVKTPDDLPAAQELIDQEAKA